MDHRNTASIAGGCLALSCECMKNRKTNIMTVLLTVTLSMSLTVGTRKGHAQNIYVTKSGSPAPTGESSAPYQMVEAGIVRAKSIPGSTVLIGPGKYYETFTIDTPCILKVTGGKVVIGEMDYQSSTTLDIITLNTHLAGDQVFMPSWKDKARAYDIAIQLRDMGPDKPDIVGFQEIWDEDLFFGGDGVTLGILRRSEYPHGGHGQRTDCLICANSGLAIMSRHLMMGYWDWQQFFWGPAAADLCNGVDCLASKGWVQIQIEKDGFYIYIVNLHTDADESLEDREARKNQLTKLRAHLVGLRHDFPDHVIFVMGDFNVYDHKDQYRRFLINLLCDEEAGGRDADRNSPGFVIGSPDQYTCSRANPLALHWDKETESGRLDYIFYFPPLDGSVEVLPIDVDVLHFTGRDIAACVSGSPTNCQEWRLTNESSDHYSVYGKFKLIRP